MPGMEDIAQLLQSLLSAENSGTDNTGGSETGGFDTGGSFKNSKSEKFTYNTENGESNGANESTGNSEGSGFDGLGALGALAGMFGGGGDSDNNFFAGLDFDMLMKMGMIFSQLQKPDKNTALLIALKPMMRSENQTKIDTALKLVRIMGLLPYLRESGLLEKLF